MRASGGVLIVVVLSLAMAHAAYGGTVSYTRQEPDHVTPALAEVSYTDALGESNNVTTVQGSSAADPIAIRDAGALVLPSIPLPAVDVLRYCSFNLTSATCRTWLPGLGMTTTIYLSGGNDRANVGSQATYVDGGSGNDQLSVSGSAPANFHGGSGADVMSGGSGLKDGVNYWPYTVGVNVTLDGVANDGMPGEGDNVMPTIENVAGTGQSDHLVGNAGPNGLSGNGGQGDVLEGLGGNDRLFGGHLAEGGDGDDEFSGGRFVNGGDGNDRFTGLTSVTVVDGGAGNDTVEVGFSGGGATIGVGAGDDTVKRFSFSNNTPLTITCGDGIDTVQAFAVDNVAADCENVTII